jgi:iron(III) transport system substrate-binding protein
MARNSDRLSSVSLAPRVSSALLLLLLPAAGCWSSSSQEVIVYTALDSKFSEPILKDFSVETGIAALPKFDVESTKTVGLTNEIMAERDRPRCDVFWNNEILNTLRLQNLGLLDEYRSPAGEKFPAMARSPKGTWHGFAARARILVINTKLLADVPEEHRPRSILDLADPRWRGKTAMAKPLFGTTATHAACLFAAWGDEKAKDFFRKLKENRVQILSGNKQVALRVGAGQMVFGLTDTDDAIVEKANGSPVEIIYPDQQDGGLGTLFIPNTLAIIRGCPHPAAARRLVDYLLTAEVESRLAAGPSAQIPLNPEVERPSSRVKGPPEIRPMQVDFDAAAEKWDAASAFLRDEMTGG